MKPGKHTTEFLALVAANIGVVTASFEGAVSAHTAAVLAVVSSVGYAISRGLAKNGTPGT